MTSDDDWTIFPGKGLGRLTFGMSPAEVDALSGTYGALTGRMPDRISDNLLRDTLEKFGDGMSAEEKQALLAVYAESGPSSARVTETRGNPGLVLVYEAERLAEIMPAIDQRPVVLDGKDLFSLGGLESLALLERLNGSPGRYASTEAAFDTLAVSVDGFCVADTAAGLCPLDEGDERFRRRTVTVRPKPFLPEGEMDRFVSYSLLR